MYKIDIPYGAREIIGKLQSAGYEAYVVGGCVRDSLLGLKPHDWDICTSANPNDVMNVLKTYKIIPTGLQHGTITVFVKDNETAEKYVGYEITTFRKDGEYKDNRRPESVEFINSLKEDLARRDFTINAMAYSDPTGIIDYFGGVNDLQNQVIACVGFPDDRFSEDALRMMRAMRFASTYGFTIDNSTAVSIHKNKAMLKSISAERTQSELLKILVGRGVLNILLEYSDIISELIPELHNCIGFEQNNPYHQYTVYGHIAHAVSNYTGNDIAVKVALLLHDIGKPQCYFEDEKGGHFHGHSIPGYEIAKRVVEGLKFDNRTQCAVTELVLYHDSVIEPTIKTVKRWLNKIGEERFSQLLDVKMADIQAHTQGTQQSRIEQCIRLREVFEQVLAEQQCFTLKDLNISGRDIMSLGVPEGKIVGEVLTHLLNMVIDGKIRNDRAELMAEAKQFIDSRGSE